MTWFGGNTFVSLGFLVSKPGELVNKAARKDGVGM